MSTSHHQQSLAPPIPSMLAGFLPPRLQAINEKSWLALTLVERRKVADSVVDNLRQVLPKIRKKVGAQFLPLPPLGITLEDLELEVRTLNHCLDLGLSEDLQLIGCVRLDELLATRGFGVRSLVDLLTALDAVGSQYSPQRVKSTINRSIRETSSLRIADVESIKEAAKLRTGINHDLRQRRLPSLPAGIKINRTDLKNRTYNCLKRGGYVRSPQKLSGLPVRALLEIPAFGKNSLIDFLAWLEPFVRSSEDSRGREVALAQALAVEARLLENMPDAEMISADDPRLGKMLRLIDPKAKNVLEAAENLLSNEEITSGPNELILNIRRLREKVDSLSGFKLEEELISILAGESSQRNQEIFVQRHGLAGSPPCTLQEVADNWGLTRERVRQVCDRIESHFKDRRPFAPLLEKALCLIVQNPPGMASEIEAQLTAEGISKAQFSLESLRSASMLLGRDVPYSLEDIGGYKTVTAAQIVGSGNKILRIAKRSVSHWGAVTMEDIISRATEQSRFPAEVVIRVIKGQKDFSWLDESSGWFWLTNVPRNRLLNQIRKVFSVTDEVGVSELRAGVRRHHRMQGFAPPERVLIELCKQLSGFTVDARIIKVEKDAGWRDLLSETEEVMADILEAHGAIMRREPFEEECIASGINRTTFYAYLNYSPVITKYAIGVYGLRGAKVAPGVVESLKPAKTKGKVLKDYGWTSERHLWVGYQLSENALMTGVCSVPSALARFIQGEFKLRTSEGILVGNLGVNKISAWGLRPFLSRKGVDVGDYLVLEYDLKSRTATIHVGDETLLDEFHE